MNTLTDNKHLAKLKTAVFLQHVALAGVELCHPQEHSPIVHEKWTPRVLASQVGMDALARTFSPCLGETKVHQMLPDLHTKRKYSCSVFDMQLFLVFKKHSAHYWHKSTRG